MDRLLSSLLSLVLFCTAYTVSLAQVVSIDDKIFTFDKLSKTIIPFVASAEPKIKTEPSLEGQFVLAFADGKGTLTFANPVPAGTYTITMSIGGKTAKSVWNVLPSELDAKSVWSLRFLKYSYGKRVYLKSRLLREAELPLQQFKIEYQFGSEPVVRDNPYSENWSGPYIPASAKQVSIAVVWVYPPTGERVQLFKRDIEPDQQPPDINASSATITSEFNATTNTYTLFVKGIQVDYEEAMDADNSDPNNSKSVKARLEDVEADMAELGYTDPYFQLRPYIGNVPDTVSTWQPNGNTCKLVEGDYSAVTGNFPLKIVLSDLPSRATTIRGTIVVKFGAKLVNRKAGKSSAMGGGTIVIPVDVPINYGKTIAQSSPTLETKPFTLPASLTKVDGDVVLVQLGSEVVKRLREELTPSISKTPAIEQAEQDCPTTDQIKKCIKNKQPVPQELMNEMLNACKKVRNYYNSLASLVQINQVYGVYDAATFIKQRQPKLLGTIALGIVKSVEEIIFNFAQDSEPISKHFVSERIIAAGTITTNALKAIPTKVTVQSTDTNNPGFVYARGSIEDTKCNTMAEYITANKPSISNSIIVATSKRSKGKVVGVSNVHEVSTKVSAGEVTLIALDSSVMCRFRETFTPSISNLEQAEHDCPTSDEIKKKIRNRQSVAQNLIDEAPNECYMVKNYYVAMSQFAQIGGLYAIVQHNAQGSPIVVGTDALSKAHELPEFIVIERGSWSLTTDELRAFKTKEKNNDPNNPGLVYVKGSIENTRHESMYDYIQEYVQQRYKEGLSKDDFAGLGVKYGNEGNIRTVVNIRPVKQ